ncbi:DNA topology modulation protein FlaR [Saccharopolyspora griseoalba]|uniref:DNA topology modulation protein FlaR n=1 Tax=Saccharopolyspora griseoalba TaxID=1431848 RepID=A0ABW2LHL9_9PSEU
MPRVVVVGSSRAGKSTFSRSPGERLGVPVISLDEHYWRPGWQRPPQQRWRREQAELLDEHPSWIADGNCWSTLDVRLERADAVVFLDVPRLRCLPQALWRGLRHRGRALQAPGCPERWSWSFFGHIWSYPAQHRPRLLAAIADHASHARVVVLRHRYEMREFLDAARGPIGSDVVRWPGRAW